ncbi:MAG TPA: SgcJ/EcaC family oxidoreductase [Glycomyces sp.]|nr:SgcJ/EcaC family oxidoreductase [Glycomyces sp.]
MADQRSGSEAATELYHRLLNAWNDRDADAYAACFSDRAAIIGFDGSQMSGTDVADQLAGIFSDHQTAAYVAKVREVRPLTEDVALLRAVVGMVPPGRRDLDPEANATQSLVAVKRSGEWRAELFQNTPSQYHGRPHLAAAHTAELRALLGR